jgi:hypothetical protein
MSTIKAQRFTIIMLAVSLGVPCVAFSECAEYKIIDHGNSVEAVCVGEPLNDVQKRELEKQKIMDLKAISETEADHQNSESIDNRRIYKGSLRKQQNPSQVTTTIELPEVSNVVVGSYDIKYVPSNKPIRIGRQFPGEYSIKIDVKNNGKRGTVKFKLKQTDFSGFETESITFNEQFEKDQQKTVTTHLPASQVPFIQSNDWIIETYKY